MVDTRWVHSRLDSPLYAALVQAVELTTPAVAADAAAGRIFAPPHSMPLGYVSTGRLGADPAEEHTVHDWPTAHYSVFERLNGHVRELNADQPFRPTELIQQSQQNKQSQQSQADPANGDSLFGPMERRGAVHDALGVNVPLPDDARCVLLFVRREDKGPFNSAAVLRLRQLGPTLSQALHRAIRHETDPHRSAPSAATPSTATVAEPHPLGADPADAAALLSRLSDTERRVLGYLRSRCTEREVAERLGRSPHTVHVHVKNIYRKLAVRSRRELLGLFEKD